MRYFQSIAGLTLGAMIMAVPSLTLAAPRCGSTAELDQALAPAKGFIRLGRGTTAEGTTIDVYIAPMTASWVAVARLTSSRSCIITEGKNWQSDTHAPAPTLPSANGSSL